MTIRRSGSRERDENREVWLAATLVELAGNLRYMVSSSERATILELFELQSEEAPCLDCFRTVSRS